MGDIELNEDQIYCLMDLENWWNRKKSNQLFQISGKAGTGKALPIETPIPTPNSYVRMGDLAVGDYVFNRHGKPVQVTGVYDRGELHCYNMSFDDGRHIVCSLDHLWTVILQNGEECVKSTKDLMLSGLSNKSNGKKSYNFKIHVNDAVEYGEKRFDIDPYIVGTILGKGYCKKSLSKFFSDDKIFDKDLHFKGIPEIYFSGSIDQRWSLIQGLFDTNGFISRSDNAYNITYSSSNIFLLDDIRSMLFSLGCVSTINVHERHRRKKVIETYKLCVRANPDIKLNFFRLSRKKKFVTKGSAHKVYKNYKYTYITDIKPIHCTTKMRCISVDDPEGLFLAKNYIVTHNTTIIKYFINRIGLDLDDVLFTSFSGKAVSVMARHGLPAKTIHSAIYDYNEVYARDENGNIIMKTNNKPKKTFAFTLKPKLPKKYKLIVVDEGSMVGEKLAIDLISFGLPMIILGDLNQLPPVMDRGYFLKEPDYILTKIMRQNENDPIVWLANQILQGRKLSYGVYGNSSVIRKDEVNEYVLKHADIIITGTNALRTRINNFFREDILKYENLDYPHIGERVICKKNDWSREIDNGIFLTNGTTGFVEDIDRGSYNKYSMSMDFRPDFSKKVFSQVKFNYNHMFGKSESDSWALRTLNTFEFAYAITAHSCLPLDTLIYTEDGIQPIGKLRDYEGKIYNGEYFEKPSQYIDNGYDTIQDIVLSNNSVYSVTNEHNCVVITKNGLTLKKGKKIRPGDYLLLRKGEMLYKEIRHYKFDNSDIYKSLDVRTSIYNLPDEIDEKLATIIGLMCADGTVIGNGKGIRYVKSDLDCVTVFKTYIKDIFGYNSEIIKLSRENTYSYEVASNIIGRFFYKIKGLRPNNKYVPKCILQSDIKIQCAFLRGLFEDGYVHNKNGKYDMIAYTFKNDKMKNQLQVMLSNLGIKPVFGKRNKITQNGNKSILNELYIFKHGGLIYRKYIGFINKEKQRRLGTIDNNYEVEYNTVLGQIIIDNWKGTRYCPQIANIKLNHTLTSYTWNNLKKFIDKYDGLENNTIHFIDGIIDKYYILEVKSKSKRFDKTVCFEMPETHMFLQNGMLGGNSQGSQWDSVIFMAENFFRSEEDRKRFMYTGITRAVSQVIIVQ